jgi:hypothetical protein
MPRLCLKCNSAIPRTTWVDGKKRSLQRRRYCLTCSPFGSHNTRVPDATRRRDTTDIVCRKCAKPLLATQMKGRVCWNCAYGARSGARLNRAYALVGDVCWRCGYGRGSRGRRLLDFHHVDRARKCFNLDCRHVVNLAWTRVIEEMRKCVLLCANCHRECEAGLIAAGEIREIHSAEWARRGADEVVATRDATGAVTASYRSSRRSP